MRISVLDAQALEPDGWVGLREVICRVDLLSHTATTTNGFVIWIHIYQELTCDIDDVVCMQDPNNMRENGLQERFGVAAQDGPRQARSNQSPLCTIDRM